MKKVKKVVVALSLATTLFLSSCIGSFGLTNRVLDWNKGLGNQFVNEVVFLAFHIVPVYELTIFADALVINSIEFWTGSNPIADNSQVINTEKGQVVIEQNANGYTITNNGQVVNFVKDGDSWYVSENGQSTKMFDFVDETHVQLLNGQVVELSQLGVDNLKAQYSL